MTLQELIEEIVTFRDERDWEQFHTPRNLAAALSVEVGELQELYLWTDGEKEIESPKESRIREEIADVLIYALLFCYQVKIDPEQAVTEKLQSNRERYPIDQAKGRTAKYTELGEA